MILVDTSVWIDHLHRNETRLVAYLDRNDIAVHPMIIGELALGSLARRAEMLELLANLPQIKTASHGEVLAFIESQSLWSRGLSLVDAHLLAALRLNPGTSLWTHDKRLHKAASQLGLADHGR